MSQKTLEITEFLEKVVYLTPPHAPVLVSTISPFGNSNLAPFEQFMTCSDFPPRVCLAITPKSDTVRNIRDGSDFCIGIPTPALANQVFACGEPLPRQESEFDLSGLTPTRSKFITSPRIKECPINFECKLHWERDTGDHVLVVGTVLLVAVQEQYWDVDKVKRRLNLDMLYYATSGHFLTKGQVLQANKRELVDKYKSRN